MTVWHRLPQEEVRVPGLDDLGGPVVLDVLRGADVAAGPGFEVLVRLGRDPGSDRVREIGHRQQVTP
ncbi:hypothetical protein [Streptomyces sp. NPDC056661]|uniref:hypothetical protein n=1 Tax=Streptomyces sp. NPDC056661 TaxID=3345898 RepID=UPI003679C334